jgi:hypothetical protein
MTFNSKPEDVFGTDRIEHTVPVGGDQKKILTPQESTFQSFMEEAPTGKPGQAAPLASPFDLPQHSTALPATPTIDSLLSQTKSAQTTLGDISSQFNTPNLKLKQSSKYLLRNKLTDANAHLQTANSKLGAETPEESSPLAGPFGKFIGYVTDGQNRLQSAQQQLQSLKDKGDQLSPADMLLVQVKLNMAQQELEYSSVVLSKAVDDIKMLFNVQL